MLQPDLLTCGDVIIVALPTHTPRGHEQQGTRLTPEQYRLIINRLMHLSKSVGIFQTILIKLNCRVR